MKFLIDAQLPKRLGEAMRSTGHDVLHTLDLPDGNRTSDSEICIRAKDEDRVVVTKDSDFVDSFLLQGMPPKLLLVSTGNISNADLLTLFKASLPAIESALSENKFVELDRANLTIHS